MNYTPESLKQLKRNASWYTALGIGLILFGALAIFYAAAVTLFSVIYLGILIAIAGIFEAVTASKVTKWSSFFLHLFLSILYIATGLFVIFYPGINALTLTLFLAVFFVIAGIARIIFGLTQSVPRRGWVIFNGILTLLLGILIWKRWPYSGFWVIGMFVGVYMIVTGLTCIQLAAYAKQIDTDDEQNNSHITKN